MLLLLLCYGIVDTSVDIFKGSIIIRSKQQHKKVLARKQNNSTEETLILKDAIGGSNTHTL